MNKNLALEKLQICAVIFLREGWIPQVDRHRL